MVSNFWTGMCRASASARSASTRGEPASEVNHHRIFIKGMLYDDPHWMSMMDRTGYRQRIRLLQDANLNFIRMVTHQSSPDMYDLCDEMGMMIWQEMPLQHVYSMSEPISKDILHVVRETTTQCRPHASIVGWSTWNEDFGLMGSLPEQSAATIRQLDASRPMGSSGHGGVGGGHVYPTHGWSGTTGQRTFFWTGLGVGFMSETGAYGLSSLDEIKEDARRQICFPSTPRNTIGTRSTPFVGSRAPCSWMRRPLPIGRSPKCSEYMLSKIAASERWLAQFMKFMFEHIRAQRFAPSTAAIHCRFDDALPSAYLGVVNFNGRPGKRTTP